MSVYTRLADALTEVRRQRAINIDLLDKVERLRAGLKQGIDALNSQMGRRCCDLGICPRQPACAEAEARYRAGLGTQP